jgi:hypothetical protein
MTIPSRLGRLRRWALCRLGDHEGRWVDFSSDPCRQERRCAFCDRFLRSVRTVHAAYQPADSRPGQPCSPVTACVRCGDERIGSPVHAYRRDQPCLPETCTRCGHRQEPKVLAGTFVSWDGTPPQPHAYGPERQLDSCARERTCTRCGTKDVKISHPPRSLVPVHVDAMRRDDYRCDYVERCEACNRSSTEAMDHDWDHPRMHNRTCRRCGWYPWRLDGI